ENAPGYHHAGADPARYVTTDHIGGGTDREHEWISAYIRAHPEVIKGAPVTPPAQHERRQAETAADRATAKDLAPAPPAPSPPPPPTPPGPAPAPAAPTGPPPPIPATGTPAAARSARPLRAGRAA